MQTMNTEVNEENAANADNWFVHVYTFFQKRIIISV